MDTLFACGVAPGFFSAFGGFNPFWVCNPERVFKNKEIPLPGDTAFPQQTLNQRTVSNKKPNVVVRVQAS